MLLEMVSQILQALISFSSGVATRPAAQSACPRSGHGSQEQDPVVGPLVGLDLGATNRQVGGRGARRLPGARALARPEPARPGSQMPRPPCRSRDET